MSRVTPVYRSLPASVSIPQAPPLQLLALRTTGDAADWHSHPFEELTLVTDDACVIGYAPGWRDTTPNTLLCYRAGERHGAWVSTQQHPRFWVVHFAAAPGLFSRFAQLGAANPGKRVWKLDDEQIATFRSLFLQMLNEHTTDRPHRDAAAAAWLQLLLVTVERWAGPANEPTPPVQVRANADVLRLWHLINESIGKPSDELRQIYAAPNYDSIRHAFRRTFGSSPREMLQRLRLEHAKGLLLDTGLSIKEISTRVGYVTQHDFNRMFHRYTGMAPSTWRDNPLLRAAPKK